MNSKGIGLIQVMIMGALISGVTLYTASKIKQSNQVVRTNQGLQEINMTLDSVSRVLSDQQICNGAFQGKTFPSTIQSLKDLNNNVILKVDQINEAKNFKVKEIKLVQINNVPNVEIKFERLSGQSGAENFTKTIPLTITLDAQNKVSTCNTNTNASTLKGEIVQKSCGGNSQLSLNAKNEYVCTSIGQSLQCPTGQFLSKGTNGFECRNLITSAPCNSGQFSRGIDQNGNYVCVPFPLCDAGMALRGFNSDGSKNCTAI